MRGADLESPPWDNKPRHGAIKGFMNGIKMYFKVRSLINSIEVTPESAEDDVKDIMKSFLKTMGDKEDRGGGREMEGKEEEGKEDQQQDSSITGEVITSPFKF